MHQIIYIYIYITRVFGKERSKSTGEIILFLSVSVMININYSFYRECKIYHNDNCFEIIVLVTLHLVTVQCVLYISVPLIKNNNQWLL